MPDSEEYLYNVELSPKEEEALNNVIIEAGGPPVDDILPGLPGVDGNPPLGDDPFFMPDPEWPFGKPDIEGLLDKNGFDLEIVPPGMAGSGPIADPAPEVPQTKPSPMVIPEESTPTNTSTTTGSGPPPERQGQTPPEEPTYRHIGPGTDLQTDPRLQRETAYVPPPELYPEYFDQEAKDWHGFMKSLAQGFISQGVQIYADPGFKESLSFGEGVQGLGYFGLLTTAFGGDNPSYYLTPKQYEGITKFMQSLIAGNTPEIADQITDLLRNLKIVQAGMEEEHQRRLKLEAEWMKEKLEGYDPGTIWTDRHGNPIVDRHGNPWRTGDYKNPDNFRYDPGPGGFNDDDL